LPDALEGERFTLTTPLHLAALLVAASLGAVAAAQQTPPSFSAGTRTVAVYATVTNGRGRFVTDLSRDDFTVDDGGKRQTLTLFSNDIQPITVIMLLDRSGSMKPNFDLEERAAEAFVREMLPQDKARIGSFSKYIQIDPDDFTSDRDKLTTILKTELQPEGPTPLWNAVDRGIDYLVRIQRGDGGWDEDLYTGTGFPGDFYINYHLYRLAFPVSALGRYIHGGDT